MVIIDFFLSPHVLYCPVIYFNLYIYFSKIVKKPSSEGSVPPEFRTLLVLTPISEAVHLPVSPREWAGLHLGGPQT